jgi:site-specific DNA recombinase
VGVSTHEARVAFRSATEPFDTTTAAGRLFVQMLGAFAEFEREVIIDRVINGMERKAASGQWTQGRRPFGYTVDPETHRLVPHEGEATIVREIFATYAGKRLGTRAIATELNSHGKRVRSGKPWSGPTITRMLNNPLYIGHISFRDITATDAHPALVDVDLFEQCQAILQARGEAHSQRAAANSDYHLTGLITCPHCGTKYVGTSATGKLRQYRYYTCFSRARYGAAGCTANRIDADLVDQAVMDALVDFYQRSDLIADAIAAEQALRSAGSDQAIAELRGLKQQITTTEAAIDRYLAAFENATLDERTCGHRVRDLTAKIHQLKARRDELEELTQAGPNTPSPRAIAELRSRIAHVFAHGTPGQRKAIIESHVDHIKIDGTQLIPFFRVPTSHGEQPTDDEGSAETSTDPLLDEGCQPTAPQFRTMQQLVPPAGFEPATSAFGGPRASAAPQGHGARPWCRSRSARRRQLYRLLGVPSPTTRMRWRLPVPGHDPAPVPLPR